MLPMMRDPTPASRLATVLHVFPTFGVGGVQVRIATLMNRLGARYRHEVLALDGCFDARSRVDAGVAYGEKSADARADLLRTLIKARSTLRGLRPEVLLTYNWGAIEWALANTLAPICPHVHLESGFGVEEADGQLWRRALMRRVALARSDRLVVPSETLADLAREVWKIPAGKTLVVPNGVDVVRFAAEAGVTTALFRAAPSEVVIGTVAPLRPEKRLSRLLRVVARVRQHHQTVRLVIAGNGPERTALESEAAALGLGGSIRFLGHVDAVETILPGFDIFALMSDTEQMPNSVLQAMAAARPVVATDVGDVSRIVAPENRPFVCPRHDEDRLADVVIRLALDAGLRRRLGQRNRERVCRDFALDTMVCRYQAILDEAVAGPRATGFVAGKAG
ncbi:MAG: glycosyltransferase [Rhodospirillales bacterium]|nr:MAG: glycosyltransferase [Rhodospirillales bacterium]